MSAAARTRDVDVIAEFRAAMERRGIAPPMHIIADGKIHRCNTSGRNGKGDASYLLHLDGLIAAGGFQNWQDGIGWEDWRADIGRELSAAERNALKAKAVAAGQQQAAEIARRQAEAAQNAERIWNEFAPCTGHPYLAKKGLVAGYGARVSKQNELVLPLRDNGGRLRSLQFIRPDGGKTYLTAGQVSGCYHVIGQPDGVVLIGSGFATSASAHTATSYPIAVAFDDGNLSAVAKAIRAKYPDTKIVIVADDDHLRVGNPGLTKARAAAAEVGGVVAVPQFGPERRADAKDFNDLAQLVGPEAVRACIETALGAVETDKRDRRLRPLSVAQFLALDIPPREMMLAPWLPEKGLAMVHSPRGVGKTHFALSAGYAVATGGALLRFEAPRPRRVVYIDAEMPANTMQQRLASLVFAGKEPPDPSFFRILSADLIEGGLPDLATAEGQAEIDAAVADAELIIVDNISTLVRSVKENEAEGWLPVQGWALAHRRTGRSVLFVHHTGKGGLQRGTSRREDVLDTVIGLRRPSDYTPDQGARFEVHFEKARGFHGDDARTFEAKYEERNGAAMWMRTEIADVEIDRVVDALKEGMSLRGVANELQMHRSKVERLKKKAAAMGKLDG